MLLFVLVFQRQYEKVVERMEKAFRIVERELAAEIAWIGIYVEVAGPEPTATLTTT